MLYLTTLTEFPSRVGFIHTESFIIFFCGFPSFSSPVWLCLIRLSLLYSRSLFSSYPLLCYLSLSLSLFPTRCPIFLLLNHYSILPFPVCPSVSFLVYFLVSAGNDRLRFRVYRTYSVHSSEQWCMIWQLVAVPRRSSTSICPSQLTIELAIFSFANYPTCQSTQCATTLRWTHFISSNISNIFNNKKSKGKKRGAKWMNTGTRKFIVFPSIKRHSFTPIDNSSAWIHSRPSIDCSHLNPIQFELIRWKYCENSPSSRLVIIQILIQAQREFSWKSIKIWAEKRLGDSLFIQNWFNFFFSLLQSNDSKKKEKTELWFQMKIDNTLIKWKWFRIEWNSACLVNLLDLGLHGIFSVPTLSLSFLLFLFLSLST